MGSISGKQVDEFAKALARELSEHLPPSDRRSRAGAPSPKKVVSTVERICAKALGFKEEHRLGIYKSARLGNAFQWELLALGHDKQFAEEATRRLVVYVAGKV